MRLPVLLAALVALAGCVQPAAPDFPDEAEPAPSTIEPPADPPGSPYTGQEARDIKALSDEEIEGYQKGAGLGYAKPAELNSYPGPLHALDMADHLGLSQQQRDALAQLRADMLAEAIPLGERYLAAEAAIERGFREGDLDEARLAELLHESADIEAQLRFAHLEAHLATKSLLTPHQVALYDEARGYGEADHGAHEHG